MEIEQAREIIESAKVVQMEGWAGGRWHVQTTTWDEGEFFGALLLVLRDQEHRIGELERTVSDLLDYMSGRD